MSLLTNLIAGYKLDEATGAASWADVLGAANLTATGTITSAAGINGGSASGFTTLTNYLSRAAPWATSGDFSLSMWLYLTATSGGPVFFCQSTDAALKESLVLGGRTLAFTFAIGGNNAASYIVTPTLNAWHHIAVTFANSGGVSKLYYDGVYRATDSGDAWSGTPPDRAAIGTTSLPAFANPVSGRIDDAYFWSKVLSDGGVAINEVAGGEIAEVYQAGLAGLSWPWISEVENRGLIQAAVMRNRMS